MQTASSRYLKSIGRVHFLRWYPDIHHTTRKSFIYIYIYIYIYIVIHRFFSVARPTRSFKLGSKSDWLYVSRISYSRTINILHVTEGIFTNNFLDIRFQLPRLLNSWDELLHSLYIYIYIYIYPHSLTSNSLFSTHSITLPLFILIRIHTLYHPPFHLQVSLLEIFIYPT